MSSSSIHQTPTCNEKSQNPAPKTTTRNRITHNPYCSVQQNCRSNQPSQERQENQNNNNNRPIARLRRDDIFGSSDTLHCSQNGGNSPLPTDPVHNNNYYNNAQVNIDLDDEDTRPNSVGGCHVVVGGSGAIHSSPKLNHFDNNGNCCNSHTPMSAVAGKSSGFPQTPLQFARSFNFNSGHKPCHPHAFNHHHNNAASHNTHINGVSLEDTPPYLTFNLNESQRRSGSIRDPTTTASASEQHFQHQQLTPYRPVPLFCPLGTNPPALHQGQSQQENNGDDDDNCGYYDPADTLLPHDQQHYHENNNTSNEYCCYSIASDQNHQPSAVTTTTMAQVPTGDAVHDNDRRIAQSYASIFQQVQTHELSPLKKIVEACQAVCLHQTVVVRGGLPFIPYPPLDVFKKFCPHYHEFGDNVDEERAAQSKAKGIMIGMGPLAPAREVFAFFITLLTGVRLVGRPAIGAAKRVGEVKPPFITVYVATDAEASKVIATLHLRVLLDQAGIVFAMTDAQIRLLHLYTKHLLCKKERARFQHRPYRPMSFCMKHDVAKDRRNNVFQPLCPSVGGCLPNGGGEVKRQTATTICKCQEFRRSNEETDFDRLREYMTVSLVEQNSNFVNAYTSGDAFLPSSKFLIATHAQGNAETKVAVFGTPELYEYPNVTPEVVKICNEKAGTYWRFYCDINLIPLQELGCAEFLRNQRLPSQEDQLQNEKPERQNQRHREEGRKYKKDTKKNNNNSNNNNNNNVEHFPRSQYQQQQRGQGTCQYPQYQQQQQYFQGNDNYNNYYYGQQQQQQQQQYNHQQFGYYHGSNNQQ